MTTEYGGQREQHGGNVYEAARKQGGSLADFLDFSANINPLGLAVGVRSALAKAIDSVVCYPDPEAIDLKQAIADCYEVREETVAVGNGAVELIYLLCRALAPNRVLLPAPTFGEYSAGARAAGLRTEFFALDAGSGFRLDTAKAGRMLRRNDLLFVCNPNNPTGTVLARTELMPLLAAAESCGAWIAVDESFIDFRPQREETCKPLLNQFACLIVLHSLTKFLAVPGLRLGFALARPELVQRLRLLHDPWNVNVMAQAAGVAGLADRDFRRRTVELVQTENCYLFEEFQYLPGCRPLPPSVNYMLADIGATGWNAARLQAALLPHRILVRDCGSFSGLSSSYIRVAVKNRDANQRLVQTIKMLWNREGC